jgi:iron complex outermembrane receptor protein
MNIYRHKAPIRCSGAIAFASISIFAASELPAQSVSPVNTTDSNGPSEEGKQLDLDQIVVTGVFTGIKKEDATVAISTVNSAQLEKLVPQSAADLITNVPGVFVDSSHGEIRNVIYSRGVSANSLDGASGYYYVAMEEDGLPVTNVTWSNFGPDYFLRADLTLDRLEAVRGGAAAVTGPNAPGGIFNYISKQGTNEHTGEISVRGGLEGDGNNPYYRADAWFGGPVGAGWTYSVGGFYRRSDGPQYPGFPMNEGGQVKFNLTRKSDSGFVQVYGKYLNDINGFSNFIPAVNFSDPRPAPGWNTASNPTPPRTSFNYQTGPNEFAHFDSSRQQESTSKVVGVRLRNHRRQLDDQE